MKHLLPIFIFAFSITGFSQVVVQPLDMNDKEFNDFVSSKSSFVSFEENFLSQNSVWNDEFENLISQWSQDPGKINIDLDLNLKRYLTSNALNTMTLNKINSFFSKPLWQPTALTEYDAAVTLSKPTSMRLFINGTEVFNEQIKIPTDETVQLIMISNKYYPLLYWGKIEEFKSPEPEAFSKFKCSEQIADRDLDKKGLLKPISNCLQKSLIKSVEPEESQYKKLKAATPYVLGGLALVGAIYFAGYELFWLGI